MPIPNSQLQIANYQIPITNCQLPITKWPKNISISSQFSYKFDSIELHSCFFYCDTVDWQEYNSIVKFLKVNQVYSVYDCRWSFSCHNHLHTQNLSLWFMSYYFLISCSYMKIQQQQLYCQYTFLMTWPPQLTLVYVYACVYDLVPGDGADLTCQYFTHFSIDTDQYN